VDGGYLRVLGTERLFQKRQRAAVEATRLGEPPLVLVYHRQVVPQRRDHEVLAAQGLSREGQCLPEQRLGLAIVGLAAVHLGRLSQRADTPPLGLVTDLPWFGRLGHG